MTDTELKSHSLRRSTDLRIGLRSLSGAQQGGRLRYLAKLAAVLFLSSVCGFGLMLVITPSARDAMLLSQRRAQSISLSGGPPPERFAAALVATEDQRFYSPLDPGIDALAIARVVLYTLAGHSGDLGGSTIPQQLAKMLYTEGRTGVVTTFERIALAIKLKYSYSKEQILSMYADIVYFGHGYYGLVAASCGYFGKAPARLSWAQAAMLAGAVNAPTADDPWVHPASARSRESHVLRRLVAVGALTKRQAEDALVEPLGLVQTGNCDRPPPQ